MIRRLFTLLAVLALMAGACGSQTDEAGTEDSGETTSSDTGGTDTGATDTGGNPDGPPGDPADVDLTDMWFGDMEVPCGPTPEGMELTGGEQGVTADAVEIAVLADVDGPRPGVNKEAVDGTRAFVDWCNSLGGVNGRTLKLTHLDTAILEVPQRVAEACGFAFANVGQAVVLDDTAAQPLVDCGMVSVPAYTVTDKMALSDNVVQSNPNPTQSVLALSARLLAEQEPETVKKAAILTAGLPSLQQQRDRQREAFEALGFEFVYSAEHAINEQNWGPFVADMKKKGVEVVVHISEPAETNNLLREMVTQGIDLSEMKFIHNPNFYDAEYLELAGDLAAGQVLDMSYIIFEEADQSTAGTEFVQILDEFGGYEPSLIAVQAFSSSLLFAQSLQAIGADTTRDALLADLKSVHEWDAGGLTSPQDPGGNVRSTCAMSIRVNDTGTGYERVFPDEGFDCDEANVVEVSGDYMGATAGG